MNRPPRHLSEEELALVQDGTPPPGAADHLDRCADCRRRLNDLEVGLAAYVQFVDDAAEPAPAPWAPLDTLLRRQESDPGSKWSLWSPWPVAAIAAGLLIVVGAAMMWSRRATDVLPADDILARSSEFQPAQGSLLAVQFEGRTLLRPAVATGDAGDNLDMTRLQRAFAEAHYDWADPLCARSFLAWRRTLREKKDAVSVIGAGAARAYRVRTTTPDGSLRAAWLTVIADGWQPSEAGFEFERIGLVALSRAPGALPEPHQAPPTAPPPVESPAGPEDTLRVLSALHQLGADVDDPITISEDAAKTHIVVSGSGLAAQRRRQIAEALAQVPRTIVRFGANDQRNPPANPQRSEKYAARLPDSIRQRFERSFGGPVPLQEATDRILDMSTNVLARANALRLLAEKFPPETEQQLDAPGRGTLRLLRTDHARVMEGSLDSMEPDLQRLLAESAPPAPQPAERGPWQAATPALWNAARESSAELNRLLAGRYTAAEGEDMLRALAGQIARLRVGIAAMRGGSE